MHFCAQNPKSCGISGNFRATIRSHGRAFLKLCFYPVNVLCIIQPDNFEPFGRLRLLQIGTNTISKQDKYDKGNYIVFPFPKLLSIVHPTLGTTILFIDLFKASCYNCNLPVQCISVYTYKR